jgi:hypothetical protein
MGSGTMLGSCRAGQPTNAVVIKRAFAITMILRISDCFFMASSPATKCGRKIATARGSVNTTHEVVGAVALKLDDEVAQRLDMAGVGADTATTIAAAGRAIAADLHAES